MRYILYFFFFFFSSRRRHTRFKCDWSSDVCSSDLLAAGREATGGNGALAAEEVGLGGEDLPADAPMEGLEPIAAHTQGGESVEGAEEVVGQGTPADAVADLEAVNRSEERRVG